METSQSEWPGYWNKESTSYPDGLTIWESKLETITAVDAVRILVSGGKVGLFRDRDKLERLGALAFPLGGSFQVRIFDQEMTETSWPTAVEAVQVMQAALSSVAE